MDLVFSLHPPLSLPSPRCIPSLNALKPDSVDEQKGIEIVRKALTAPCATIAKNAGVDPSIVVQKVTSSTTNSGYDALHDRYVDMIEEGELYIGYLVR